MTRSSRFWDRVAGRYARKPVADEAAYEKKLAVMREYLRPDMQVLEFGCGTGSTAIVHAPHVKEIRAIDISEKMLEIARSKAEAAGVGNVRFERTDIDAFSAPDGSFDAVLGLSILHLLEDRNSSIANVYRMLKPGGVFVSSTACLGDTMKLFKLIGPIGRLLGLMPLVRVFTAQELVDSLEAAGFAIDHRWQPGKGKPAFIVAKKPGLTPR
jgi:ubiquinone/menaquinone biosynthesis C-methylase UbiE